MNTAAALSGKAPSGASLCGAQCPAPAKHACGDTPPHGGARRTDPGKPVRSADPEYSRLEEQINGWTHAVGAALGIAALVAMLVKTAGDPSAAKYAAVLIYGISLIALYSVSAAYHFTRTGKAKRILRTLDHSTIFLLIAGCYTPFCLLVFNQGPMGMIVLVLQWGIAAVGIGLNLWNMRSKAVKIFSMASYVAMGWMAVVVVRALIANVTLPCLLWLLAGGIAYTVGIVFYAKGHKKPFMHSVWHVFVLAGSILQFVSIFMLL